MLEKQVEEPEHAHVAT